MRMFTLVQIEPVLIQSVLKFVVLFGLASDLSYFIRSITLTLSALPLSVLF